MYEVAGELVRKAVAAGERFPLKIRCTPPGTNRTYWIIVTESDMNQIAEKETRATIGGGGGRCGCCNGTGKA